MTLTLNHLTTSYGRTARYLLSETTQPAEAGARAALETFYFAFNNRSIEIFAQITSRYFQYSDNNGGWRQVHHHGSIDDADLLKTYQDAVNS